MGRVSRCFRSEGKLDGCGTELDTLTSYRLSDVWTEREADNLSTSV